MLSLAVSVSRFTKPLLCEMLKGFIQEKGGQNYEQ